MVYEHAILSIKPGQEEAFEAAFAAAPAIFAEVAGCHGLELRRGVEEPSSYQLIIGWDDVDAHLVGYRQSPASEQFRELLGPFLAGAPALQHYEPVAL